MAPERRLAGTASASPETEVESLGQRVSTQWFFNDVRAAVLAARTGTRQSASSRWPRLAAARYLGITPGALHSSTVTIRTWQKDAGNAEAYQQALHRVAEIAIHGGW